MGLKRKKKLKSSELRSLSPGMHSDGDGLYLQVIGTGGRSWIFRFMERGRRRDLGLGGWPKCSLEKARDKVASIRTSLKQEKLVLSEMSKLLTNSVKFEDAARRVLHENFAVSQDGSIPQDWIKSLEKYMFPFFGDLPVSVVGETDIFKAIEPLWAEKPETAKRVLQRVAVVLRWSQAKNLRLISAVDTINNVKNMLPIQRNIRSPRKAMPFRDVPGFLKRLRSSDLDRSIKIAFEFLILTVRSANEVSNTSLADIDINKRVWSIRRKNKGLSGFKMPLSRRALQLATLAVDETKETNLPLFLSSQQGNRFSQSVFLKVLSDFGLDYTIYGFKRSFRDWSLEQSTISADVVKEATSTSMVPLNASGYTKDELFKKRRDLMEAWAWFLG